MPSLDDYPERLHAGYYDGARLLGTREGGAIAEYYNPSSHGVVTYEYRPALDRLDAAFDPERPLQSAETVATYVARVERHRGGFDALSAWARRAVAAAGDGGRDEVESGEN